MIRYILAILLVFSTFSATQSWASGSNTVFLPVKSRSYLMSDATSEVASNPQLRYYIERVQTRAYVARVGSALFNKAATYAVNGYDVQIDFEFYESIVFRYYPSVDAIIGFTSHDDLIILSCY